MLIHSTNILQNQGETVKPLPLIPFLSENTNRNINREQMYINILCSIKFLLFVNFCDTLNLQIKQMFISGKDDMVKYKRLFKSIWIRKSALESYCLLLDYLLYDCHFPG